MYISRLKAFNFPLFQTCAEISKKEIKITNKCKYKFLSCNCLEKPLVISKQFKLNSHNDYNIFFWVSSGRWSEKQL